MPTVGTSKTLNTFEPDDCCGNTLSTALLSGALDNTGEWTHKKCGQLWRAEMVDGVRWWKPEVKVWIL